MASAEQYLMTLLNYLNVDDRESQHRLGVFEEVRRAILLQLSDVRDVVLFGSFARGTSLSLRVHPESDSDLVLVIDKPDYMKFIHDKQLLEHLKQKLGPYLRCRVDVSPPCVTLNYRGLSFDLFPAMSVDADSRGWIFMAPYTHWHVTNEELLADTRFRLGPVGIVGGHKGASDDTREMVGKTDPIADERLLTSYERTYGPGWRFAILLLKYWKRRCSPAVAKGSAEDGPWSWLLEESVMYALDDYGKPRDLEANPVDFVHGLLSRTDLYPYQLLSLLPGFIEFRRELARLAELPAPRETQEALALVKQLFPVPGPAVALPNASWGRVKADLGRGSLLSLVGEVEEGVELTLRTCDAFAAASEPEVIAMLAEALVRSGSALEFLERPGEAAVAYRRVYDRYWSIARDDVRELVIRGLQAETKIHQESKDHAAALVSSDRTLRLLGDGRNEHEQWLVLANLYNRALMYQGIGDIPGARRSCQEAEARCEGKDLSAIANILVDLRSLAGWLARREKDWVDAERMYARVEAAASLVPEVARGQRAAWAQFEQGCCLIQLECYDPARTALDRMLTRYSSIADCEEVVKCARLVRAIIDVHCETVGGRALLEQLVGAFAQDDSTHVRHWVAVGTRYLAG